MFTLTFQSLSEIFIGRSWYSVLPRLNATIDCQVKKAVMGLTHLITVLVSIYVSYRLSNAMVTKFQRGLTFAATRPCSQIPLGRVVLLLRYEMAQIGVSESISGDKCATRIQ